MEIEAVIFDMDGVIFDSEPLYRRAWMSAAETFGIEIRPALYEQFIGLDTPACEELLATEVGADFAITSFRALWQGLYRDWVAAGELQVKPGFPELLNALRDRPLKLAVASGSSRQEVAMNFRGTNFLDAFATVASRDDVAHSKPSPDIYFLVAQRLQLEAGKALVLEDTAHGATAALAAGMQVILVPDIQKPDSRIKSRCVATVASLYEAAELPPLSSVLRK